jgi:hypothetical protein
LTHSKDAPLPNIFHPYARPALECLDVLVSRDNKGIPQIEFEDKDGMPSRRVKNLQRVFRLHERWPDRLRLQIGMLRDEISDMGCRIRRYADGRNLTRQELKCELEDTLEKTQEKLGMRPD